MAIIRKILCKASKIYIIHIRDWILIRFYNIICGVRAGDEDEEEGGEEEPEAAPVQPGGLAIENGKVSIECIHLVFIVYINGTSRISSVLCAHLVYSVHFMFIVYTVLLRCTVFTSSVHCTDLV